MKNIIKPFAALSLAAMLALASGCGEDTTWSFKDSNTTLSNGNWIYYTYAEYNEASSKINEEKNKDSSNTSESSLDMSKEKVENKKALDWIYDQAKDACVSQLTVEKLVKENKVKIDEDTLSNYEDTYKQYYEQYFEPSLSRLGISSETYVKVSARNGYLSSQLFGSIYDEGGTKAVSDKEIQEYFKKNYIHYFYLPMDLTTTVEEGESQDMTDEQKEEVQTRANKYKKMLNDGSSANDVVTQYQTDTGATTDPSTSATVILDKAGLNETLQSTIEKLDEGKAEIVTIDKKMYVVYKGKINDYVKNIKKSGDITTDDKDAIDRLTIIHAIKDDEYKDYIDSEKKKLKYETNDACLSKYTVQRTIDILNQIQSENSTAN